MTPRCSRCGEGRLSRCGADADGRTLYRCRLCGDVSAYAGAGAPRADDEPPVGTARTGSDGSRWVKARVLGEQAWSEALTAAVAAKRTGALTTDHICAMGYRPVAECTPDDPEEPTP